jgi:hypothetical protein
LVKFLGSGATKHRSLLPVDELCSQVEELYGIQGLRLCRLTSRNGNSENGIDAHSIVAERDFEHPRQNGPAGARRCRAGRVDNISNEMIDNAGRGLSDTNRSDARRNILLDAEGVFVLGPGGFVRAFQFCEKDICQLADPVRRIALEAADVTVQERLFLIGKDGINGPDLDRLRKETTANVNGADDSHFEDPAFVKAAKDMHEAKLLAEGGFQDSERTSLEQRYERAEKELFARMESLGREIETCVTSDDSGRLKDHGLKAESTSVAGYGSAEHHDKFAESLAKTGANDTQIRGRLAAARSEGTHPSAAVTMGKGAAKARKSAQEQQRARREARTA